MEKNKIKKMNEKLVNKLSSDVEYKEFRESFPELDKRMVEEYQPQIIALVEKQVSVLKHEPTINYTLFAKQNGFEMMKLIKDNKSKLKEVYPDIPFEGFLKKYLDLNKQMKDKLAKGGDGRKFKGNIYAKAEKLKNAILYAIGKEEERVRKEIKEAEQSKLITKIFNEIIERIKKFNTLRMLNPDQRLAGNYWDLSKGTWKKGSIEKLMEWKEKFEKNEELKRIVKTIGRSKSFSNFSNEMMKVMKRIKKKSYENEFKEEMIGITEGNDISAMLPSELIYLADERLKPLFYKKYSENKLPIYEFRNEYETEVMEEGTEQKKKEDKKVQMGPVILCIDTSGSMQGMPELVAKSLSLSVILRAIGEKRPVYLISFGTEIETTIFDPEKFSIDDLLDFMNMSFNNGTDPGPALKESIRITGEEKFKDADVVMVSDFIMGSLDSQLVEKMKEVKKTGTRFLALIVNANNNNQGIPHFDKTWLLNINRPDEIMDVGEL